MTVITITVSFIYLIPIILILGLCAKHKMKKHNLLAKYYYYNGYCNIAALGLCVIALINYLIGNDESKMIFYTMLTILTLCILTNLTINIAFLLAPEKAFPTPCPANFLSKIGQSNFTLYLLAVILFLLCLGSTAFYADSTNISTQSGNDTFPTQTPQNRKEL